jgi:adenine-specific DNA-methyltransferase
MAKKENIKQIEQYEHGKDERANIPHVGLVTPASDPDTGEKKKYQYDPHLDPQLQWAGKAEHTSFEVPTVSLHVHERIDPKTIIETVKKERKEELIQPSLFEEYRQKPLREAIDFYKHKEGWTNRLIAGDSLLVMNSLLEKEGMAGKVQMVFFDPPYGIKYGSNFMPFVNKRDVKDGKDDDLNAEPEMIKAFRDTWELGIHSYLTYLRDRLLLAREMLAESGSIFVQISDENVHHIREIMDEIFKKENFISEIIFTKTAGVLESSKRISSRVDFLLWYCKDPNHFKYNPVYTINDDLIGSGFNQVLLNDGTYRGLTKQESEDLSKIPSDAELFRSADLTKSGPGSKFEVEFKGKNFNPRDRWWGTTPEGFKNLIKAGRIISTKTTLRYVKKAKDFPYKIVDSLWTDFGSAYNPKYVVETHPGVIERCLHLTSHPGDLVLDITCGSGTTAYAAEKWGRRWITCDTSRVALTLAKQRLLGSLFDYYELAHEKEGISSGLKYEPIPHITLKSIANQEPPDVKVMYDKPFTAKRKTRVSGPFTVEAVPAPYAKSFDELEQDDTGSDTSIARSGETNRQAEWRDELLRAGVRAKGGNIIQFTRVEPLAGTKYIQAEAETKEDVPKKVLVVFGPEHAPLEQRMVENAWQEARALKPDMLLFCAFQFDEEAAKDIDELTPAIAGMQLIKAQMNADMLTDDLRKKRSSNESFWLVGQPDVRIHKAEDGKIQVEVMGFDYYNPKTGNVESGGKKNIAMWMLDTDYDNRSLFPSQVFFPMAGAGDGWDKLAKNLKAEIDEEKIEAFKGTISLPFEAGSAVAVKIIDDRGIESLRVLTV